MNRVSDLLERVGTAPELGPLRQPLADLLAFHISGDSFHGPLRAPASEGAVDPALDVVFPSSGVCHSCGDTGGRYNGTNPEGHMRSEQQHCCQHGHCACGGFPATRSPTSSTSPPSCCASTDRTRQPGCRSVRRTCQQRYLVGYLYAVRDGGQWVALDSTAHDGAPLVILLPSKAGEPARTPPSSATPARLQDLQQAKLHPCPALPGTTLTLPNRRGDTVERYRDPDCSCGWSPTQGRITCQSCRLQGPLPGSLADESWEMNLHDPAQLRAAADRLAGRVPPVTAGPRTPYDRKTLGLAESLRQEADRLASEVNE